MSSWAGFTDRLRRHARSIDVKPTTRGYLEVAAERIESLESKLADAKAKTKRYDSSQDLRGHQR